MRGIVIASTLVLAASACKGNKTPPASGSASGAGSAVAGSGSNAAPAANTLAAAVPVVDGADVTILPPDDGKFDHAVPLIAVLEASGELRIAKPPAKWTELAATSLDDMRYADQRDLDMRTRENVAFGKPTAELFDELPKTKPPAGPAAPVDIDLALGTDDPPPPEEEDAPDDGADESGGTGTAMALEEGKMGKKDSDRAEGQYKMQKNQDDPQLARQRAIEQARNAGILGNADLARGGFGYGRSSGKAASEPPDWPSRLVQIAGRIQPDGDIPDPQRVVIAAHPQAKAKRVVETIAATEGMLLVAHGKDVKPLRLYFARNRWSGEDPPDRWIEVRVSPTELVVEGVPGAPTKVGKPAELATAYKALAADKQYGENTVDVLVDDATTAQRLVDVLAALDRAGAKTIQLGDVPKADSPEAKLRGAARTYFRFGRISSVGELDRAEISKYVRRAEPQLRACYETARAKQPALGGTVTISFLITGSGSVQQAAASGVDPAVADCMAKLVKGLEFPAPKNGGNVQAQLPLIMR